jgi:uncharacterized membrane protein
MFFAYMALRPASGALEPPQRLALWARVLGRFFPWVWLAVIVLLATGYWMIFVIFGGFAGSRMYIHLMQGLGIIMMLLFLHLFFAPYRRLQTAVAAQDWPVAAKQLNQIRIIVATNLLLGLIVVIVAAGGRYLV